MDVLKNTKISLVLLYLGLSGSVFAGPKKQELEDRLQWLSKIQKPQDLKAWLWKEDLKALGRVIEEDEQGKKLANAYEIFNKGNYVEAHNAFDKIAPQSLYGDRALIGAAWSEFKAEKWNESLSKTLAFSIGKYKSFFQPEAYFVAAANYMELCHYPEALKMVKELRDGYAVERKFLNENFKDEKSAKSFAIYKAIEKENAPKRVHLLWLRDPYFRTLQTRMNDWIEFSEASQKMRQQIKLSEQRLSRDFLAEAPQLAKQKGRLKTRLKEIIAFYRGKARLKAILSKAEAQRDAKLVVLREEIEEHLREKTIFMTKQLANWDTQMDLLEAELGAEGSRELIRAELNEDEKDVKKVANNSSRKERRVASAPNKLDWGSQTISSLDSSIEIWDDELNALTQNLVSRCSNR